MKISLFTSDASTAAKIKMFKMKCSTFLLSAVLGLVQFTAALPSIRDRDISSIPYHNELRQDTTGERSIFGESRMMRPPLQVADWETEVKSFPTLSCLIESSRYGDNRHMDPGKKKKLAVLNITGNPDFNRTLLDVVVSALQSSLRDFDIAIVSTAQVSSVHVFNSTSYNTLLVTQAGLLPVSATGFADNYLRFLTDGGGLVSLGGKPAFIRTPDLYTMDVNAMSDYEPYHYSDVTVKVLNGSLHRTLHRRVRDIKQEQRDGIDSEWAALESISVSGLSALSWIDSKKSTMTPVMAVYDQYGRQRGLAASLTIHRAGTFKGGEWLFFGVSEPTHFYATPSVLHTIAATLESSVTVGWGADCKSEPDLLADIGSEYKLGKTFDELPTLNSLYNEEGYLKLSDDKRTIVYPDGRQFFMLGADFYRSILGVFNAPTLQADMEKAAKYGLNSFRMFGYEASLEKMPDILSTVREVTKSAGVYLLIDMDCKITQHTTVAEVQASTKETATLLRNETWLVGYDLCNEPYYWELQNIMINSTTKLKALFNLDKENETVAEYMEFLNPGWSSTFPNLGHGMPIPAKYEAVMKDVSGIYGTWLGWRKSAIRSVEDHSLLTIGYNTLFGLLPFNSALDFVSHHAYPNAANFVFTLQNYTQSLAVPTTMDRLAYVWNNPNRPATDANTRPISYGEYGSSNGDILTLPDGSQVYLDFQTGALYDMIVWLRAVQQGNSGALRWRVNDVPYILSLQQNSWRGNDSNPEVRQNRCMASFILLAWNRLSTFLGVSGLASEILGCQGMATSHAVSGPSDRVRLRGHGLTTFFFARNPPFAPERLN